MVYPLQHNYVLPLKDMINVSKELVIMPKIQIVNKLAPTGNLIVNGMDFLVKIHKFVLLTLPSEQMIRPKLPFVKG